MSKQKLPPIKPKAKPDDDAEHRRQVDAAYQQMIDEERAQTIAASQSMEIPDLRVGSTPEIDALNPSNYRPPTEADEANASRSSETVIMGVIRDNPSVVEPAPAAEPAAADTRQQWVCVESDGIRTGHPAFGSDAHLLNNMVECPVCQSRNVRKVQPGEDLEDLTATAWKLQPRRDLLTRTGI